MTYEFESHFLGPEKGCSVESVLSFAGYKLASLIVIERAVECAKQRKAHRIPERIEIYEKAFPKVHRYDTLVYD